MKETVCVRHCLLLIDPRGVKSIDVSNEAVGLKLERPSIGGLSDHNA